MTNYVVSDLTRKIAAILRGHMAQYGITQAELGEAIGVSQSQLSKLVRGVRPIELEQFVGMCESMGLDAGAILQEAEAFLADYDVDPIAKIVYVEDGKLLPTPHHLNERNLAPVVAPLRTRAGNVTPIRQAIDTPDLMTVDLDHEVKAASQDDGGSPEYPNG
ncbi:XRE family transcriptional regulator [Mycetocola tolaasinivorans]|uniref:XRE family transcriptional regulator n=1 Tax=Mycetocola tolaasinivorans TaxID=76635 RepID=A0A3L7A0Y2_9MICO|nr:helix-turn-helix transcriptional regulator [Mycetocola tolaasinivorans]RLP73660.1 XRE family transcriptional regulator [Mycetocola tolaasinivorans]